MALSLTPTPSSPALSVPPYGAWDPLPAAEWNASAARHLLRRAGWTALPAEVDRAAREGLAATLERLFPKEPALFPEPRLTARIAADGIDLQRKIAQADPQERRMLQRAYQEKSRTALVDMSIRWIQYASRPENSAFAKWVLFLSDVYVVSYEKIQRSQLIYQHFDILARNALGRAPDLSKAVSRSPAMIIYLDLNQSQKKAPNENFARELFELFVLGEGNYTEKDIKESARAFTGYRVRPQRGNLDPESRKLGMDSGLKQQFYLAAAQHDEGEKTIFGHKGNFSGDDVIDLAYATPAAGAFLPHELVKFYLSDTMLPKEYLYALGGAWKEQGYDLRWLAHRFFGSRIFFADEFRGEFIKSPVQLYIGLLQDLDLDVIPVPRFVLNPLRQMGQVLFTPPNVRGWVGGRNWINSSSLAARRTLVETIFAPISDGALNEDERLEFVAARTTGQGNFTVTPERFAPLLKLSPEEAANRLASELLAKNPPPAFRETLQAYLSAAEPSEAERLRRIRRALVTVLESPGYQVC